MNWSQCKVYATSMGETSKQLGIAIDPAPSRLLRVLDISPKSLEALRSGLVGDAGRFLSPAWRLEYVSVTYGAGGTTRAA